ncbi:MAG TPA: transcriptional regulator NrdR [Candidatus Krumholzibacteria bacterium]|nr:transcriptional regulator NrdR [Candidatus Krumholzibacteria bacterium]
MRCPACGHEDDKVVDSRSVRDGMGVRRRRECTGCHQRYTTYEFIEQTPVLVIKKDGQRQAYERDRILTGLVKACEKRPISRQQLEELVDEVERVLLADGRSEIPSREIGEAVMNRLQSLDEVAYVRFASVYRSFRDVNQFMEELRGLLQEKRRES